MSVNQRLSTPATETLDDALSTSAPHPLGTVETEAGSKLERGAVLGRYILLDRIGEGGMGKVFAAYDPELDRRVAIKVLRPQVGSSRRLMREARALARLQHPNVLRVYDVGSVGGRVFLATELLNGSTVARWLAEGQRPWPLVVDVFLDLAQGLEAAHAQGLVHRDVKPSNLMITRDGRGIVMDFGIAREVVDPEGALVELADLAPGSVAAAKQAEVDRSARAGTPGFMAPEQVAGGKVGPAADQYGFCKSLHWALLGRWRPEDESSSVPGQVPGDLLALVERGLSHSPEDRYPSMGDLVEALAGLRRRRERRRRRLVWVALGLLAVGLGGSLYTFNRASCFQGEARFANVWSQARQQKLEAKLLATEPVVGVAVWRTLAATLMAYGKTWSEQGETWCRAGRRGAMSADLVDLRTDCLDQRLREVEASLALALASPEIESANLSQLFDGLTPLEVCEDGRALRSMAPPPPDQEFSTRLDDLRHLQAETHALWAAGNLEAGRQLAERVVGESRRLDWGPIEAEALYQLGLFKDALVEDRARETLLDAALTAAAARHDRVTAQSFVRLVRVAGLHPRQAASASADEEPVRTEVESYTAKARQAIAGLGRPALLEAELLDYQGLAARQEGEYSTAVDHHQRALKLKTAELGPRDPSTATTLLRLGNLYDDLDDHTAAYEHLNRALNIQVERLGPAHPTVADTHSRLGTLAREDGDHPRAREHHERALSIRLRMFGPDRVPVAESLTYLGELKALEGEIEGAQESFEQALQILRSRFGPDHPHLGVTLATMASAWTEVERDTQALEPYGRALEIFEKAWGAEHPQVGVVVFNLATVRLRLREPAPALRGFRRATKIWRVSLGADHALVANALTGAADALERLGRPQEALGLLEEVSALDSAAARGAKWRADTHFVEARARWAAEGVAGLARQLAELAEQLYLKDAANSRRELDELRVWMAKLPPTSRAYG